MPSKIIYHIDCRPVRSSDTIVGIESGMLEKRWHICEVAIWFVVGFGGTCSFMFCAYLLLHFSALHTSPFSMDACLYIVCFCLLLLSVFFIHLPCSWFSRIWIWSPQYLIHWFEMPRNGPPVLFAQSKVCMFVLSITEVEKCTVGYVELPATRTQPKRKAGITDVLLIWLIQLWQC